MTHSSDTSLTVNLLLPTRSFIPLEDAFKDQLPPGTKVLSGDEFHFFANTPNLDIIIAQMPFPVGFNNLDQVIRSNTLSQKVDPDAVRGHTDQIKIILKTEGEDRLSAQDLATVMLRLCISSAPKLDVLAVHWEPANSIQTADVFQTVAPYLPKTPPLSQISLAVRVAHLDPQAPLTLLTEGLCFYTGYDIGLVPPKHPTNEDVRDLLALAQYALQENLSLEDGETLSVGHGHNGLFWSLRETLFQERTVFVFERSTPPQEFKKNLLKPF